MLNFSRYKPKFKERLNNKNTAVVVIVLIIFFAAAGFIGRDLLASIKDSALNKYAQISIKEISVKDLNQKMNENQDLLIIDVRTEEDYNWEHIKGSVNIPLNELNDKYGQLDKKQEIITVCDNSECEYSRIAARRLQKQGFKKVKVLADGVPAWSIAGYPTIKSEDAATVENIFKIMPITSEELDNIKKQTKDLHIIDLRSEAKRNEKVISGAIVYEKNNFENKIKELSKDKTIILVTDNNEDAINYGGMLFDTGFIGVRYLQD